jgi:hypothetical protein
MKRTSIGGRRSLSSTEPIEEVPFKMFYAGLDLSRKRLDVHVVDAGGETVVEMAAPPDGDGLRGLAAKLAPLGAVRAAIESMNGARFVHDRLEELGWEVAIADAQRVKGLAPLACKTDRIDAWVPAELSRRDLVPAIWLPDPQVRAERERARWRLYLVRHRVQLKNRVHATLIAFGKPCPVSDLFGQAGRELLDRLDLPDPWRSDVLATVAVIDLLDVQIGGCERELRRLDADHDYVAQLTTPRRPSRVWRQARGQQRQEELGPSGTLTTISGTPSRVISTARACRSRCGANRRRHPLATAVLRRSAPPAAHHCRPHVGSLMTQNSRPTGISSRSSSRGWISFQPQASMPTSRRLRPCRGPTAHRPVIEISFGEGERFLDA